MIYVKHVQPYLLYQDLIKRLPNFKDIEYDLLEDIYGKEDPIVLNKIFALRAMENGRDRLTPLGFLLVLRAFSDIGNADDTHPLDAFQPSDIVYALIQYTSLYGEPDSEFKKMLALILAHYGYYTTPFKPIAYMRNYMVLMAPTPALAYKMENNEYTPEELAIMHSIDSVVINRLRYKAVKR